ncbi:hypothetical protein OX958_31265 [Kribbella sp. CA-293567]|nr:hypothetical protein [Kribbella sp. CA-293567]WBQ04431.1 hypothetical protein OX958_31265 [Kribbella sp. CA-293567]
MAYDAFTTAKNTPLSVSDSPTGSKQVAHTGSLATSVGRQLGGRDEAGPGADDMSADPAVPVVGIEVVIVKLPDHVSHAEVVHQPETRLEEASAHSMPAISGMNLDPVHDTVSWRWNRDRGARYLVAHRPGDAQLTLVAAGSHLHRTRIAGGWWTLQRTVQETTGLLPLETPLRQGLPCRLAVIRESGYQRPDAAGTERLDYLAAGEVFDRLIQEVSDDGGLLAGM